MYCLWPGLCPEVQREETHADTQGSHNPLQLFHPNVLVLNGPKIPVVVYNVLSYIVILNGMNYHDAAIDWDFR